MTQSAGDGGATVGARLDRLGWTAIGYRPFRLFIGAMLASTSTGFLIKARDGQGG